jgi:hypothetical protein
MLLIDSVEVVANAIDRAKKGATAYCTNLFPTPRKLEGWITDGGMLLEEAEGAALFLRRDRGFWHLHFCAGNPVVLRRALTSCPELRTESVVVDVVGREPEVMDLADLFERTGFRLYQRLFRMARASQGTIDSGPDPRIVLPENADVQPIHELLLRSFDCRAEQVPMPFEIEAAAEAGQIRVARFGGRIGGLLFFETQGLTSTLRYWLTPPEFRGVGLGSALMRWYLAEHSAVRRFLLWVVADNADAIQKYERYGYAPDGLLDRVLANKVTKS